ncbi:MAG: putative ribosome quality control (RQC) complex YloA/Tae2 family protein [Bacteroidia bacterium]|jgi:predicted ribosome quality control (RQC) complex YloA/Tae2 family protein
MSIIRTTLRFGFITLAVGGTVAVGAAMIAGPQRSHMVVDQIHAGIMETIDENIEDPRILRTQLKSLEKEYPQRISELRDDLSELRTQISQLTREESVSRRVMELSQSDLDELVPLVQELNGAVLTSNSGRITNVAQVRFNGRLMTTAQTRSRINRINQTKEAYASRAADANHDLVYLRQQEQRMEDLLVKLESEQTQFQAQLWQLERQVDAIARNERLIDMMSERQQTLDSYDNFEVKSLDNMTSRLTEVRSRQEAELEFLSASQEGEDYEGMARLQIDGETINVQFGGDLVIDEGFGEGYSLTPALR